MNYHYNNGEGRQDCMHVCLVLNYIFPQMIPKNTERYIVKDLNRAHLPWSQISYLSYILHKNTHRCTSQTHVHGANPCQYPNTNTYALSYALSNILCVFVCVEAMRRSHLARWQFIKMHVFWGMCVFVCVRTHPCVTICSHNRLHN